MTIVGLGQEHGGDDAIGLHVIRALKKMNHPDLKLLELNDPTALLPLLISETTLVIIDAVLGEPVGEIKTLAAKDLGRSEWISLSTHGLGLIEVLHLANELHPERTADVQIVGIQIPRPRRGHESFTAAVESAIPKAAEQALTRALKAETPAADGRLQTADSTMRPLPRPPPNAPAAGHHRRPVDTFPPDGGVFECSDDLETWWPASG